MTPVADPLAGGDMCEVVAGRAFELGRGHWQTFQNNQPFHQPSPAQSMEEQKQEQKEIVIHGTCEIRNAFIAWALVGTWRGNEDVDT